MLWALLAMYLFGSSGTSSLISSFDRIKTSIKADVAAPDRRTALILIVDEAEKTTKEEIKSRHKVAEDLLALIEKHDAKTAEMQSILARFRTDSETFQERMIRYRFELKTKMTREEWAKVFPATSVGGDP